MQLPRDRGRGGVLDEAVLRRGVEERDAGAVAGVLGAAEGGGGRLLAQLARALPVVREGVLHRIYDEYGSQKAFYLVFFALFQPQLACPQHINTQS